MDSEERSEERKERVPWQQLVLDDVFLLVMAGLVIPTVFYLIWGLWSLSNVEFFTR